MQNPLSPNQKRAQVAVGGFFAVMVMSVIVCISDLMQVSLLTHYQNGQVDYFTSEENNQRQNIVNIANVCMKLVNIVLFIMWFRRAYYNLEKIRVFTEHSEGWAAGAWFVPILNWIRPFQMMKELWHKTQEATEGILHVNPDRIVNVWWTLHLLNYFSSTLIRTYGSTDTSLEGIMFSTWVDIGVNLLNISAAIAAVMMVKKMSEMETNLFNSISQPQEKSEDLLGYVA